MVIHEITALPVAQHHQSPRARNTPETRPMGTNTDRWLIWKGKVMSVPESTYLWKVRGQNKTQGQKGQCSRTMQPWKTAVIPFPHRGQSRSQQTKTGTETSSYPGSAEAS